MNNIDVLKYIQSKFEDFQLENDTLKFNIYNLNTNSDILTFDTIELTLNVDIARTNNNNGVFVTQMIFTLSHPLFDTPLIESVAGIGKSQDDAILNATDKFCTNVLLVIISTLKCQDNQPMEVNLLGKKHIFYKNCFNDIISMGEKNPKSRPLWDLVEDIIPTYLGTKKFYWLKLFVGVNDNHITCEARLNNIVYNGLSKPLEEYANSWTNKKDFHSEKQFVLLIQDNSTYQQAPFTKNQVVDYTKQVIPIFESIKSQSDYEAVKNKIFEITKDTNLTTELTALIPEIYCKIALKMENQITDKIMLFNGNSSITEISTSQMRSYDYIEETIFNHIYNERPNTESIMGAISCSAIFSSINNMLNSGSKIENILIGGITMFIDSSYTLW